MKTYVRSDIEQALTKLSYIVIYPPGQMMLQNGTLVETSEIATNTLNALVSGGGVTCPSGNGWAIGIVNNDTGEVTMIGQTE